MNILLIYLYLDTSFSSFSLRGTYQKVFLSLSSIRLTLLHQTPINLYLIFYILELNLIFSLVEKFIYFSINFIANILTLKKKDLQNLKFRYRLIGCKPANCLQVAQICYHFVSNILPVKKSFSAFKKAAENELNQHLLLHNISKSYISNIM